MTRLAAAIRRTIRAALHTGRDLARLVFAPGTVLCRAYLIEAGLAPELADRFGSPFGKVALRLYREQYGRDPRRTWSLVNGKVRRVNGYLPGEQHILAAALATYRPRDKHAAAAFDALTHHAHTLAA